MTQCARPQTTRALILNPVSRLGAYWRAVLSHHPQEVLQAQLSIYVYKGGLNTHPFMFFWVMNEQENVHVFFQFFHEIY